MSSESEILPGDEAYYDEGRPPSRGFDSGLLQDPVGCLRSRPPVVLSDKDNVTAAMRAMQRERRGCVLVTEDGTTRSRLAGIFTERDVLNRIIDRGRNPGSLPLGDVMTRDPETVPDEASIAWVLNKMAVGGFRHVPIVKSDGAPDFVVSMRDVVEFLVEFFPNEIMNLPPTFAPQSTSPDGA